MNVVSVKTQIFRIVSRGNYQTSLFDSKTVLLENLFCIQLLGLEICSGRRYLLKFQFFVLYRFEWGTTDSYISMQPEAGL